MKKTSKENEQYKVQFESRKGYLYAYIKGNKDSLEAAIGYWTEIAIHCRENSFSKLLVEEDIETDNSVFDIYELISHGHEIGLAGIKIAFVDRHPEQMKNNMFAETVAHNRGIIGKVFSKIQEAEKWLLS